jgi:hypothetical protein
MTTRTKIRKQSAPAMRRSPGSVLWYESGPEPITADPKLATVIVKVGLAINAIHSVVFGSKSASEHARRATSRRDAVAYWVTAAAFLKEATELASKEMKLLRPLALRAGMKPALVDQVVRLCHGDHKAWATLRLARKKIGFHWDDNIIGPAVMAFANHSRIVWVELERNSHPVHTLAFTVLVDAIFPCSAEADTDLERFDAEMDESTDALTQALELIARFFHASTRGYLKQIGATRRTLAPRRRRRGE